MSNDLKYGWLRGGKVSVPWAMTAAQVLTDRSGRFASRNTSTGAVEVADTTGVIFGWIEGAADSSTDTGAVYNVIVDTTAVFRIPLVYDNSSYTVNYSAAILGETCDLYVASNVQYADPTNAATDQLIIVGGKAATGTDIVATDGYLDVMMNPNAMHALAVGA